MNNLPKLKRIHTTAQSSSSPSVNTGTMTLQGFPSLEEILFDGNGLLGFDKIILKDLPALTTFRINATGESSVLNLQLMSIPSFCCLWLDLTALTSVYLAGDSLKNLYTFDTESRCLYELIMIDLPSLQTLYFGASKGSQRKDFSVGNLPALTTLEFEKTSFPKVEVLNLTSIFFHSELSFRFACFNQPYLGFLSTSQTHSG